jgi:L-sorbose 1-phosphate reductase
MPLTAIEDFEELGKKKELFKKLADSVKKHNGLWNGEAEKILFKYHGVN